MGNNLKGARSAGPVAVVDGQAQRLPVPRSSEYPAFRRDHWAMTQSCMHFFDYK